MRKNDVESNANLGEWRNDSYFYNLTSKNNVDILLKHNESQKRIPTETSDEYSETLANPEEGRHNDIEYVIPNWMFVLPPSLFNFVPLGILVISYCMIWVKIKRSNHRIEGMVAFNKQKNEVIYQVFQYALLNSTLKLVYHMIITIIHCYNISPDSIFSNDWDDFRKLFVLLNITNTCCCIGVSLYLNTCFHLVLPHLSNGLSKIINSSMNSIMNL